MAPTTNPYYSQGSKYQVDMATGFAKIQADAEVNAVRWQMNAVNEAAKNNAADQTNRFGIQQKTNTDVFRIVGQNQNDRERNYLTYQGNIYNFDKQSGDRQLGLQKDYALGIDKNTRDQSVGFDRNAKTLEGTKYGDQLKTQLGVYQWNNVSKTAVAEAQVKAGTYGVGQEDLNNRAADKAYRDKMNDYADRQLQLNKYTQSVGDSYRAYSDQQEQRRNDQAQAMSRYNQDMSFKQKQYDDQQRQASMDRNQQMQERSNATTRANANYQQQQINANQDYALRKQIADQDFLIKNLSLANQTAQINSNIALDNSKYSASRADLAYNRNYQSRSFAF
jgi:hypothetical protein